MTTIPAQYRVPSWWLEFKRDWESNVILVITLILGLILMWLLATWQFPEGLFEAQQPERFARITVGGGLKNATIGPGFGKIGGGIPGKRGQGGGKGQSRGKGAGKGGTPQSLLGVIGSRSTGANSALGRVFQSGGLGANVDQLLGKVKKGKGFGTGGTGGGGSGGGTGGGIGRGRGTGAGELGDGSGAGTGGIGDFGTGYGGGGDSIDLGVKSGHKVSATLTRGKASIEGALDPALIDRVVRSNLPGLKYCYEKQLNLNPKLTGKVIIQFTIGTAGTITEAAVESSSMKDPIVEDCLVRRVQRWRFPKPEGGSVIVAYPFVFTPGS